jgi:hypothetical protein
MSESGILDLKDSERADRIKKLQDKLNEISGGKAIFEAAPDAPLDILEAYVQDIINFESIGSGISLFEGLQQHGVKLPSPDTLNEFLSRRKVMEIFRALKKLQVFIIGFEKMSARELYSTLWNQTLWEGCYVQKQHPGSITLLDASSKPSRFGMQQYVDKFTKGQRVH